MPVASRADSPTPDFNAERYDRIDENPFVRVADEPLSTFSIDVDTASYANVRRFLGDGVLPPKDAVRIEELVNAFDYEYPGPASDAEAPLTVHLDAAACPWTPAHRLVRVAMQARQVPPAERPAANLVFLLDTSGSMGSADKLPLVKAAVSALLPHLTAEDRVAVVAYAGTAGLVLPPTPGDRRARIAEAVASLEPAGGTRGSEGIELAYELAAERFVEGGINRVILATDGDFNLGVTDRGALTRLIEEKAATGVYLTVLGFGRGNLNDAGMEELSNRGDGNYAYIGDEREAKRVLGEQVGGTLHAVAKDVKLQVEFNPAAVAGYRLIGYENRVLEARDFNDDRKDAGDLGAGQAVTAFYEVVPAGVPLPDGSAPAMDGLRYQTEAVPDADAAELLTVKARYKQPAAKKVQGTSKLLRFPLAAAPVEAFASAEPTFRFAAAVAAWGMLLRESEHAGAADHAWVTRTAEAALAEAEPADRERWEGFLVTVRGSEGLERR